MSETPTSSGKPQGSDTSTKPPRLRSACTECHTAKTRCSGEKTGCQRCQNNGLVCKYGVSMVGRALKRQQQGSHGNGPRTRRHTGAFHEKRSPNASMTHTSPSSSSTSSVNGAASLGVQADTNDLEHDTAHHLPLKNTVGLPSTQLTSLHNFDAAFHLESAVAGHHIEGSASPSRLIQEPSPVSPQKEDAHQPEGHMMSSSVTALCKIIQVLEKQIQDKKTSVDDVMRTNKECCTTVQALMEEDDYKNCKSCPMLLSAALGLMVMLYEEAIKTPIKPGAAAHTCNGGMMPNLVFGVFQIDPEDQVTIRSSIISKELHKFLRIIEKPQRLTQADPAGTGTPGSHILAASYKEMEIRVNHILCALGGTPPTRQPNNYHMDGT
ncbi:hypothetical protein PG999_004561 [Apiospora kogelbergensis]|uniref:Zn(2)-C6 fungal-type domain-containing protein n=1 Tax=Apiospora kogelbergensis TaxID=1337665 RepID=A0AAW0QZN9_9PEZI